MKLVRISHSRCREYDGTEYVIAPDEWDDALIERIILEVQEEMLNEARAVWAAPFKPPPLPPYRDHPDKTVGEVERLHAAARTAYNSWLAKNKHMTRSLSSRLIERGFLELGTDEAGVQEVNLDWGHNHDLKLNYRHAT